jgi:hypothetical protein
VLEGYCGPLKIQLCGPWTLAATLGLPRTPNVAARPPGGCSSARSRSRPAEAKKRHADLSLEITEADHRYYILDSPTISDID